MALAGALAALCPKGPVHPTDLPSAKDPKHHRSSSTTHSLQKTNPIKNLNIAAWLFHRKRKKQRPWEKRGSYEDVWCSDGLMTLITTDGHSVCLGRAKDFVGREMSERRFSGGKNRETSDQRGFGWQKKIVFVGF